MLDWKELHRQYKRRFVQSKKMGIAFVPTELEREAHRQYGAAYASTPKGREILRAGGKKYRQSRHGRKKCSEYNRSNKHKERTAEWSKTLSGITSRARSKAKHRNYIPPNRFDIDTFIQKQGGMCPICLRMFSSGISARLDHCHKSGSVRGALCDKCNMAVGLLGDNPECCKRAAHYIVVGEKSLDELNWPPKVNKKES